MNPFIPMLENHPEPRPRSAYEIARAAHEHEKRFLLEGYYYPELDSTLAQPARPAARAGFALFKAPARLLAVLGQWLFVH